MGAIDDARATQKTARGFRAVEEERKAAKKMKWTKRETNYLIMNARMGAREIANRLGRTVHSVENKASRLGVSLVTFEICPNCAKRTFIELDKYTGWCRVCTIGIHTSNARELNSQLREEIKQEEARIADAERERHTYYSDNSKQFRKLRKLREERENHGN